MAQIDLGQVVGPQGEQGIQGPEGPQGPAGPGVVSGGTDGQFLQKDGSTDYSTKWKSLTGADLPVSGTESTKINAAIGDLRGDIGVVEDGDTAVHAITSGQYVIWKGSLYKASSNISVGGALSVSNLTAVSNGIGAELNALNSNLTTARICEYLGTVSSLAGLESALLTIVGTMSASEARPIRFYTSATDTVDNFKKAARYSGHIYLYGTSPNRFSGVFTSTGSDDVVVGYDNGTWYFNPVAYKSDLATKAIYKTYIASTAQTVAHTIGTTPCIFLVIVARTTQSNDNYDGIYYGITGTVSHVTKIAGGTNAPTVTAANGVVSITTVQTNCNVTVVEFP